MCQPAVSLPTQLPRRASLKAGVSKVRPWASCGSWLLPENVFFVTRHSVLNPTRRLCSFSSHFTIAAFCTAYGKVGTNHRQWGAGLHGQALLFPAPLFFSLSQRIFHDQLCYFKDKEARCRVPIFLRCSGHKRLYHNLVVRIWSPNISKDASRDEFFFLN